jgi:hypothetical protein
MLDDNNLKKRSLNIQTLLISLLTCLLCLSQAQAGVIDKSIDEGEVRIHFPENHQITNNQCTAVLMGMGTAMRIDSYDKLATHVVGHGHVFVAIDYAPGNLVKTDAEAYLKLAEAVKDNLLAWLSDSNCNSINHWVMGGHSAGGQAAQNAVANRSGLADAIFSIDPYNAKDTDLVHLPAMYWGFDTTTCFVEVDDAAKEAYLRSNDKRAFYQVNTDYSWGPCGYSPTYFHCSFCDGHCPACTNCKLTPDHFFVDVAQSLDRFISVAFTSDWSKQALSFEATTPFTLFVDGDLP